MTADANAVIPACSSASCSPGPWRQRLHSSPGTPCLTCASGRPAAWEAGSVSQNLSKTGASSTAACAPESPSCLDAHLEELPLGPISEGESSLSRETSTDSNLGPQSFPPAATRSRCRAPLPAARAAHDASFPASSCTCAVHAADHRGLESESTLFDDHKHELWGK